MWIFVLLLLAGFSLNAASVLTASYSRRWGQRRGSFVSFVLRNILGIPVWAVGFVLAFRAPSSLITARPPALEILGLVLLIAGGIIILAALVTIKARAALPSTGDALVQKGLYAWVRHPIHSGTFLEFLGLFLFKPSLTVAAACALGVVWIIVQTLLEERDLLQRIPAYGEYMKRVPRFFPRRIIHHERKK
jgi:protein-S-isoprenylcysteine O-methyltransferase Ste14